jgi:type IV secretion system protein TrbG
MRRRKVSVGGMAAVMLGAVVCVGAAHLAAEEPAAGVANQAPAADATPASSGPAAATPAQETGATAGSAATEATTAREATEATAARGTEEAPGAPVAADVAREARAVAAGREPAVLEHGDVVLAPYGHQVPVLRCAPLRVCLIELEEGELVLNTVTGDAARWILDRAVAGPRAATTVIVAKPTACNLTTNLVITTDRRIYQITLDARPCRSEEGENPHEPFTRLLRFYYPDELVRTWATAAEAKRAAAAAEARAVTPLGAGPQGGGPALAALHFNYR